MQMDYIINWINLNVFLSANNIDVICITETHFNVDILDAEIGIEGFCFLRKDGNFNIAEEELDNCSGGGGSIIYYRSYLDVEIVQEFLNAPDSVAIGVHSYSGIICIACVYRSMSLSTIQNEKLLSSIDSICNDSVFSETVLLGDLNLPDVSWVTGSIEGNADNTSNKIL